VTRADLVDWLKEQGCEQIPFEGLNISGRSIKFFNPKTGRHTYVDTPVDEREIPDFAIAHICDQLLIKSPDSVAEQQPFVKQLKKRFTGKITTQKGNK